MIELDQLMANLDPQDRGTPHEHQYTPKANATAMPAENRIYYILPGYLVTRCVVIHQWGRGFGLLGSGNRSPTRQGSNPYLFPIHQLASIYHSQLVLRQSAIERRLRSPRFEQSTRKMVGSGFLELPSTAAQDPL